MEVKHVTKRNTRVWAQQRWTKIGERADVTATIALQLQWLKRIMQDL